ncbi:MAG: hypothetical protein L3J24_07540 [Xanthomonadales bacterium]|nr:hypothetical protein [Xanthomonadales bacterium]
MQTNHDEENRNAKEEESRNAKEEESSDTSRSCWEMAFLALWIFIGVVVFVFSACFIIFNV